MFVHRSVASVRAIINCRLVVKDATKILLMI